MNKKDGIAALFFLGLALVGLIVISPIPFGTLRKPGVSFFPIILSVLLIIFSLVLFVQSFKTRRANREWVKLGERWKKLIPIIIGGVAYVILFKPLGYLICTFLILILFAKVIKASWKSAILISSLCTLISYIILRGYMQSPLPQGIIPFF